MKQHITRTQLNELSEKGFEKLTKWLVSKGYVSKKDKPRNKRDRILLCFQWEGVAPSIGQMIEFLDEAYKKDIKHSLCIERMVSGWSLYEGPNEGDIPELADCLWEACKEILNG